MYVIGLIMRRDFHRKITGTRTNSPKSEGKTAYNNYASNKDWGGTFKYNMNLTFILSLLITRHQRSLFCN